MMIALRLNNKHHEVGDTEDESEITCITDLLGSVIWVASWRPG
jgi:hypothetical protein